MERVKVLPSEYSQSKASETGGQTKELDEAEEDSRVAVEDSFRVFDVLNVSSARGWARLRLC